MVFETTMELRVSVIFQNGRECQRYARVTNVTGCLKEWVSVTSDRFRVYKAN
jgi:hypothetical protein